MRTSDYGRQPSRDGALARTPERKEVIDHPAHKSAPDGCTPRMQRCFWIYLAFAAGIAFLLALYFIVRHRAFAFVDTGIDLFSYYYPLQVAFARQLHRLHELTWSFELGLGGYIGVAFDPSYLLTALLPESWQLGIRLPLFFLKALAAGAFLFGLLRKLGFDGRLAIIGALGFTYGSYAVVNGQWDFEGTITLQFAAYLFFLEGYLRGGNRWYAVAGGLSAGVGSVFTTFTLVLLTAVYLIARPMFTQGEILRKRASAFLRFCAWATLGFMLTAAIQIPNLHYFLDSPRVSGGHALFSSLLHQSFTLNDPYLILVQVASLFGKDVFGTASHYHGWSNYFEAPGFYVGILTLVCVPQLLGPSATRREKLLCVTGLVLFGAYVLWPAMRHAVYGFGHKGFRLSTLWVSTGILLLGLGGLRRAAISGVWRTGLAGAAIALIALALLIATRMGTAVNLQRIVLAIAFVCLYALLLWPTATSGKLLSMRFLIPLFACELLLFAMPAFIERNAVHSNGTSTVGTYHDGTTEALAYLRTRPDSQEFYRVEKTYRSVFLDDALVQDYSGTKSYFFHGRSITRFVDKMKLPRPHPRVGYIAPMTGRRDVLDLLGVKYLLARDRKLDRDPGMGYITQVAGINIYENEGAHAIGHLYRSVVGENTADRLPVRKRGAYLLEHVTLDDPTKVRRELARMDASNTASATATDHVSVRKRSDVHLDMDVQASKASVLLISMPFDAGWHAQMNGVSVPLFRADYGLTALTVPPGQQRIALRYEVVGRSLGEWLSLAALLVLTGHTVGRRYLGRRIRSA